MKKEVTIRKRTVDLSFDMFFLLSCFCDRAMTIPLNSTHLRTQLETEQPWTYYKFCGHINKWFSLFKNIVPSAGTAVLKLTVGGNCLVSEFERIRAAVIGIFPDDCNVFYCLDLVTKETEPLNMDLLISSTNPFWRIRDNVTIHNSQNRYNEDQE
jgi:hypothetical protein